MIHATTGLEAIEKTQIQRPDLVLMDVQMPMLDGLSAVRLLRSDPDVASTKTIMLTARAMTRDHQESLSAGADAYLAKPVVLYDLMRVMRTLLDS